MTTVAEFSLPTQLKLTIPLPDGRLTPNYEAWLRSAEMELITHEDVGVCDEHAIRVSVEDKKFVADLTLKF